MILNTLLNIFFGLINFIINLFPNFQGLNENIEIVILNFSKFINNLKEISPIFETIIEIIQLFILIEIVIITFFMVNWIYNKIRGAG